MANLGDNIRLTTVADLQALSELVNEYKKLGLSISGVAGASRIVSEQIKRDALEQANSTKQATLQTQLSTAELNRQSAELRKNNLELKAQAAALNESKKSSDSLFGSLSSISGLRSQLIGLFGAMSVGAFAKDIIDAQSQVEAFGLSMNNLLGQKYGEKLVSDLKKFTVETPLNFEDVIKSSNQLVGSFKAAGASSREIGDEIPKILESLGNSAAALGGDGRLGRLTYAFSQVQATGRLMGTEVRQITETGFPLLAVMSQTTGKSVQELQKDITAGKVSFEQFKTAILSAGKEGGVFAGAMDIMANTVRGRLDKLSETFFFAKARIGDALTSSAKSAIDFGNALIKSLFGTDEATKNTIEYVKQLALLGIGLKLVAGYEAALATGKRILNALELAGNVIRTQMAVVTATAAGNTTLLAAAELEAAAATRVFSSAVSSSTLGAFLFIIGAAIGAYELYKSNLEEVNELTFDNIKATDSDVKALMTKQSQLNATANSALGLSEETAGYRLQVGKLIKQYPEYFGNLDAEKASHDDIRKALFFANNEMERKIKLMVQEKLAEKLADRSADLRIQIAQEEITAQAILDKRAEYQKKQLELKKKGLADEYTEQLGAYKTTFLSLDESNKKLAELKGKDAINQKLQQKATNNLLASEQEDYQIRHNAIIKKWNDKGFETRKQFTDAITALDEEYGYGQRKRAEATGKAGKEAGEKALKYQKDTAKEKEVFEELVYVKGLEKTRQHETAILDIQQFYDLSKIKNSIGSQKKKNEETAKITKKYLEDTAELNRKWDKEESEQRLKLEEISLKEINDMRSKFRVLNSKDDKESLKEQLKAVEDKYKLEMDVILKSNSANAQKRVELMRTIILEEKEISTIKTKLEQLKTAENLRGEAAKKIKRDTDDINEKTEFRNRITLEQIEHEKDLAQAEAKRYDGILDLISGIAGETKEVFNLNDAINKSKIANDDLIKKKENLLDITSKGQLLTKEGAKAQKEADEATVKSVEATNQVQLLAYTTLLSVAQKVFEGIKKSIVENMLLVNKSYEESNRIFQEFVVKKREADLKAYEEDLEYRLTLSENNLDKQLSILEDYFNKAKELIDERDLADAYAAEFESLVRISNEKTEFSAKLIEGYSINGLETIKNMVTNTLTVIGKANDGLTREQELAYRKVVSTADSIIEKLEWQRDNTVDLLDRTIDIYKDKYEQQTKIVKDETDKQIDAINSGLSANLDRLGSFYDAQGDAIRTKYGDILDNNVRYTDTAFDQQLAIWNSARDEQEGILKSGRDANIAILKSQYENGTITLEEYLSKSSTVNSQYQNAILAVRTKFYDDLEAKTKAYNEVEAATLKKKFDDGLISETDYNTQLGILDDIKKQRSKDIKSVVTKDRDEELAYLKEFYYDAKVFEEQKAADAIVKINQEAATKLQGITASSNAIILDLENRKRQTILSYNSQIFEESRRLALAQAELAQAEGKAAAWKNPFTARGTIRDIEAAFSVILSQIASAINPFAGQLLEQNILDNQVPVNNGDGNPIPFAKGTDNLSTSMSGTPKAGKTGGWLIEAHEGEAIFSKPNMDEMTRFLGKRPTRDEVIDRFKMGTKLIDSNSFIQKISPYVIKKSEGNVNIDLNGLRSDLSKLTKEVVKRQQPIVNIDKNGIRTYLTNINSQIEIKNQKFSS